MKKKPTLKQLRAQRIKLNAKIARELAKYKRLAARAVGPLRRQRVKLNDAIADAAYAAKPGRNRDELTLQRLKTVYTDGTKEGLAKFVAEHGQGLHVDKSAPTKPDQCEHLRWIKQAFYESECRVLGVQPNTYTIRCTAPAKYTYEGKRLCGTCIRHALRRRLGYHNVSKQQLDTAVARLKESPMEAVK